MNYEAISAKLDEEVRTEERLLRDAERFMDDDEYEEAVKIYRILDEDFNSAEAQYWLGGCYTSGWGVTACMKTAFDWHEKAAAQGWSKSREKADIIKPYIEEIYYPGADPKAAALADFTYCPVKREASETFKLYQDAAKMGNFFAIFQVGNAYIRGGESCEKDYAKAFEMLLIVARQNDSPQTKIKALILLVYLFSLGYRKKECFEEVYRLYKEVYRSNLDMENAAFLNNFAMLYSRGWGTEVNKEEMFKLYLRIHEIEPDNALYMANLGVCYYEGNGCDEDYDEARRLFHKAALLGSDIGQSNLGCLYRSGKVSAKDYTKAFYWFSKAAEQNSAFSMANLAQMYMMGWGCEKDYAAAYELLRKAADGYNDTSAWRHLGRIYERGLGQVKDLEKAFECYEKSADDNDEDGLYALGRAYYKGVHVEMNRGIAKELFQKAAVKVHKNAVIALRLLW